jgi:uncharacterized circularly permuted ATP-grasp superfamily protein
MLRESLETAAPPDVEEPCVAVVTRGDGDPAYFEHNRLAVACGLRLLTLADCQVRDGEVRDRSNGRRIDVIYRRFDEDYVETDLPELEGVYLEGRVNFVNAFGVGVADDKAVFPYVPAMIERYLGEEPILNNVRTFSLSLGSRAEGGGSGASGRAGDQTARGLRRQGPRHRPRGRPGGTRARPPRLEG